MTQQKAEVKETDLPQAKPTETEDADRLVTEDNSKKPKEDEAQVAKVQTETSEAAEKHIDQSPTKLEDATRQSETTKAPNPGIGKDKFALTAKWGKKISAYFDLHKKFPENRSKDAKVKLALVINRVGKVLSVAVMESSGDAAYDDAAVSTVHRSNPVPRPARRSVLLQPRLQVQQAEEVASQGARPAVAGDLVRGSEPIEREHLAVVGNTQPGSRNAA
jgi:periplasmic protein TonB